MLLLFVVVLIRRVCVCDFLYTACCVLSVLRGMFFCVGVGVDAFAVAHARVVFVCVRARFSPRPTPTL